MKNKRIVGLIILLVVCEGIGIVMGNTFFGLFEQTVPPAVLTSFNKGTAHAAFVTYGVGAGAVVFVVSIASIAGARLFR
jgi:hypothetical protein